MNKLIKLEIKKHNLLGYVKGVFITDLIVMAFMWFIYFADNAGGEEEPLFANYHTVFFFTLTLTTAIFLIFGSVVLARVFIEEYKNKTISLLFTYPISRKKMFLAKLIVAAGFIFSSLIFTNILIGSLVYVIDLWLDIIPNDLTMETLKNALLQLIIAAITLSGIGLIPLFFGMWKKSVPTTIVCAIILVSIVNSVKSDVVTWSNVIVMFVLAIIGVLMAYLSFRNIEKKDLIL